MKLKSTKMMVVLAALCMLALPVSAVMSEPSEAANTDYDIAMFVGDTFSYEPTTNLTTVKTESGSALTANGGFLSKTGGVISGTPVTAGAYQLVVTATWTSEEDSTLTQTATQTIDFTVHAHTIFTSATSSHAVVGSAWTYTPVATGSGAISYSNPVTTGASWCTWDSTNNRFSGTPTSEDTYTLSITATAAASGEAKTLTLTVSTYSNLAITSASTVETYVGRATSYTVTTNYDGNSSASITKTASLANVASVSSLSFATPTISGAFTSAANAESSPWFNSYNVTVGATGTLNGNPLTAATKTVTFKVWANVSFTSAPSTDNVDVSAATGDPMRMVLTADISGATSIVYNWGDGTRSVLVPDTADEAMHTVAHTYAEDGSYVVSITATNEQGTSSAYVFYNSGDGSWNFADAMDAGANIIDEHGYLFLILGIAGIGALVAWFAGFRMPLVLMVGAALVIASVGVYCFGGKLL